MVADEDIESFDGELRISFVIARPRGASRNDPLRALGGRMRNELQPRASRGIIFGARS